MKSAMISLATSGRQLLNVDKLVKHLASSRSFGKTFNAITDTTDKLCEDYRSRYNSSKKRESDFVKLLGECHLSLIDFSY